jgi:hypothetical protein
MLWSQSSEVFTIPSRVTLRAVSRFDLKTGGYNSLRFGLKTCADGFFRFDLKTGKSGFSVWGSKPVVLV